MGVVGQKYALWQYLPDMPVTEYKDQMGIRHKGHLVAVEAVVTVTEVNRSPQSNDRLWGNDLVAKDDEGNTYVCHWDPNSGFPERRWVKSGKILMTSAVQLYNEHSIGLLRPDGSRAVPTGTSVCSKHDEAFLPEEQCFHCLMDKRQAEGPDL